MDSIKVYSTTFKESITLKRDMSCLRAFSIARNSSTINNKKKVVEPKIENAKYIFNPFLISEEGIQHLLKYQPN